MKDTNWCGRHIISIADFDRDEMLAIIDHAAVLEQRPSTSLEGRLMATLFFEPSTRTRLSFEAAMAKLGGAVIGFSSPDMSSARKGESLADTIRMVDQYADVIVMRHPRDGSARLASEISRVPVINGGDGSNQHPTQTFLDLYTIHKLFPDRLRGSGEALTVAFAGDLKYGRTVHSLLSALSLFPVRILLVPAPGLDMPAQHTAHARAHGIEITTCDSLQEAVAQAHVLYMTRLQEERFPDPLEFQHIKAAYRVHSGMLARARPELRILHPLPRVGEIDIDVDTTMHAQYFDQAGNGVPVRMALLDMVLGDSGERVLA